MNNNSNLRSAADGTLQSEINRLKELYRLKTVELQVENRCLELIQVANMDDLLDSINDVDELPFWAEIWPAAIGLSTYIFRNQELFNGKRILELGSGTGLTGIAAKLAGGQVTQSDFINAAFQFIRINCLKNHVPADPLLLADWRNFPTDIGGFDAIIGADILYEKTFHAALIQVFNQALTEHGSVFLADPGRDWARQLLSKMVNGGWQSIHTQIPIYYQERDFTIDIYKLTPPGNRAESVSL